MLDYWRDLGIHHLVIGPVLLQFNRYGIEVSRVRDRMTIRKCYRLIVRFWPLRISIIWDNPWTGC